MKLKVALISGGISSEREVSLKSGDQVYQALDKDKYDIERYDPQKDMSRLVLDAPNIEFALVILHGPFGEDGTIQGMLDMLNIPYQGSGVLGSAMAMNKLVSKKMYENAGLLVPDYQIVRKGEKYNAEEIKEEIGFPLVIKPSSSGSSIGLYIVHDESQLEENLEKSFPHDETVILEKYIEGMELTGGIIGNESLEALPLIEIVPGEGYEFFDYEAKYIPGATEEICPARVDEKIAQKAQNCAVTAHNALFLKGYSRTDMILQNGDIYVLETNTIPGMTATSLFPQSAYAAGYTFTSLLDRLIELGLEENTNK